MIRSLALTITAVILIAGSVAAEGPLDHGSVVLNGDIFFRSQSGDLHENDNKSHTLFTFMPAAGYFISPRLMLGSELYYTSEQDGYYKLTGYGIGPSAAYFFDPDPEKIDKRGSLLPYVQAFFAVGKSKEEFDDGDYYQELSYTTITLGGQIGAVYMVSNSVGIDLGVLLSVDRAENDDTDDHKTGHTIQVGAGITSFIF